MKYAEYQGRTDYEPWSVRQCALYHRYNVSQKNSVYVLISPVPQSQIEADVLEWIKTSQSAVYSHQDHLRVNQVLWTSYLDNWKPYMNFYEEKLQSLVSRIAVYQPKFSNFLDSRQN